MGKTKGSIVYVYVRGGRTSGVRDGEKGAERAGGSAGDGMGAELRADSAAARHICGSPHQVGEENGQHKVITETEMRVTVLMQCSVITTA